MNVISGSTTSKVKWEKAQKQICSWKLSFKTVLAFTSLGRLIIDNQPLSWTCDVLCPWLCCVWWRCSSPLPPFLMYSVCLTLRHLFGCFIFYTHWPVSPSTPPTPTVPLYTHPSLTISPSGFHHSAACPPFFQLSWLLPTSSQLPAAPITSHLSTFHPFVSSLLSSLHISQFPSKLFTLLLF